MGRPGSTSRRGGLALLVTVLLLAPPGVAGAATADIGVYRGLGAWIDIYDRHTWKDPEGWVRRLDGHGVRTLYLETTSYRWPGPVRFPEPTGRFIDAAHAVGMKVVAWYVPDFVDVERDLEWSLGAIRFTSPSGDRFDSFAMDIEVTEVRDVPERSRRMLALSRRLRRAVGDAYPLGAIIPSPHSRYWPGFPYAGVARVYDVILPMAYSGYHAHGEQETYDYIASSVDIIRRESGRSRVPIHVIGGIADDLDAEEGRGFVRAANDKDVIGASYYDVEPSGAEDWGALSRLRSAAPAPRRPRPDPAIPLAPRTPSRAYGNVPGGDLSHRAGVVFESPPIHGPMRVAYQAFDLGRREVALEVNGRRVRYLPRGREGTWSGRTAIDVPARLLSSRTRNRVAFVPAVREPGPWGVRRVTALPGVLPLADGGEHGAVPGGAGWRPDRVVYRFGGTGHALAVLVRGFDVGRREVVVRLNGRTLKHLRTTKRGGWDRGQAVVLPAALLRPGPNELVFEASPDGRWGVRLTRRVGLY